MPFPTVARIAPSSPASRPFVPAALQALRLDPDCEMTHAHTPPRNGLKDGHHHARRI